jgi:hypothetical protein
MFFYTGYGWIALIGLVVVAFLPTLVTDFAIRRNYTQEHGWPILVAGLACFLICLVSGLIANRKLPHKVFDKVAEFGAAGHTFFWIRLEYAGLLSLALSVILAVVAPKSFW